MKETLRLIVVLTVICLVAGLLLAWINELTAGPIAAAAREEKMAAVRKVLEEQLPPDLRLITDLLARDYPEETDALLEENRGLLTDDLLKTYDEYVASLGWQEGQEEMEKVKKVREQIVAKMAILRP